MMGWIEKVSGWLMDGFRHFYPVTICFFGGLMMVAAGDGFGLAGVGIAIVAFAWATDLAATKAAAKAKEETAAVFIANLMSGTDTELTVTFRDLPPPPPRQRGNRWQKQHMPMNASCLNSFP